MPSVAGVVIVALCPHSLDSPERDGDGDLFSRDRAKYVDFLLLSTLLKSTVQSKKYGDWVNLLIISRLCIMVQEAKLLFRWRHELLRCWWQIRLIWFCSHKCFVTRSLTFYEFLNSRYTLNSMRGKQIMNFFQTLEKKTAKTFFSCPCNKIWRKTLRQ